MQFVKDITEIIQHMVEIAAIAIGAVWTYFNFIKGRTYKPALALSVQGMIKKVADCEYLDASVAVKNVGRAKVDVSRKGTALIIWETRLFPPQEFAYEAIWEELATYPVLEAQAWIEPGEEVEDQILIALPSRNDRAACKIELRVASQSLAWKGAAVVTTL
ncbi:MAG: hypothetical protein ACRD3T_15020 [Terriglobia bacterium]